MAINNYSFLSTTIGGGFPQTGGSSISGSYFTFIISPVGGNPGSPVVIAADDFNIGNAAENPSGSNIWFAGNVDASVEKVEFVDLATPYDISNTVEVRVYLFSGTTMPNADLTVLVDVDYTTPTFGDGDDRSTSIGRPMCLNLYPPAATNECDGSGGANPAYAGISSFNFTTFYLTPTSNNPDGASGNPFCSGFNHYRLSGTITDQPTMLFYLVAIADTGYYFPEPGIQPIINVNSQGLDFSPYWSTNDIITRNADNQITVHKIEFWYTPPDPPLEDTSGSDSDNITKFCNLDHYITFTNYTPVEVTSTNNGTQQMLQLLTVNGQTGVGSATDGFSGPTPISVDGETRSIYIYGSDFAGYDLSVKQVTGGTTKTLDFASTHPAEGLEVNNTFTSSTTSTGVIQLNILNPKAGRATYYPSGKPYAVDYARRNENSKEDYRVDVAYQEYKVLFPKVAATTYYDVYVTKSDSNESGNSDATKENVTTGYAMSGTGSGATSSNPIRIYQYADPSISIRPSTNVASSYDAMPSAVEKTTVKANVQFTESSTGTVDSSGHMALSFAIGAASDKTLSLSRQPVASDFSVISGGNGLVIYYEDLAATVAGSGDNNTVNVTGIAYIEQTPVDDTVINLLTQNFISPD